MSVMTTVPETLDKARFAGLFDGSPVPVLITLAASTGSEQRIVYVNPAFERMTGWSREAITGLTPAVLQGPETDHSIFPDLREKLALGESWRGETVNYRRDGTPFRMKWSISPVRDGMGRITAFLAIQEDVTEQHRIQRALEESEQRYRAIFEQSYQLVGILSPDGTVQEVNDTALRFGDYQRSQIIGQPFWETPWWQACEESRTRLWEGTVSAADGTIVHFQAR